MNGITNLPDDATHKVVWGELAVLFKRSNGAWYTWVGGDWHEAWEFKFWWCFGWKMQTRISSITHKMIPIKRIKDDAGNPGRQGGVKSFKISW
ncbi:hypothetical protein HCY45_04365 [Acinetobacter radioresistens]|uniref:hypothetical protein n=1 Tax=Acinetobacter radioresistens TaxID=40216 RepID=UPI002006A9DC|nr:hypothetical protein [Acinetobacter radioresistens]MCK4098411.1 hypothetical protein [Acinetobacter radioresistens]